MPSKNARAQYLKIEGTKELRRELRRLEDRVGADRLAAELKAEMREAVEKVAAAARRELASGMVSRSSKRTGALSRSIRTKGALRGGTVMAGGTRSVPYAGPIHYGWPGRPNAARGWRGGPIRANPFLDRGLARNVDEVRRLMRRGVERLLVEVRKAAGDG